YDATLTRQFLPWCASEEIQNPGDLTPQVVGRFTARLIERQGPRGPLSRSTVRSYVRAVRVFLAWVQTPEGGAAAVGASPRLPRPEQRVLDVLTREEIQTMENAAKTERDKLIVRVLADCGLRLGEVLALRAEDLWEPRRGEFALKVRGKGSRDR
ncbi:phage integrase family protein, partial [mine drainage metagenome]